VSACLVRITLYNIVVDCTLSLYGEVLGRVVIENGHPTARPAVMFDGIVRVTLLERNWEPNREFIYTGADPPPFASPLGVRVLRTHVRHELVSPDQM